MWKFQFSEAKRPMLNTQGVQEIHILTKAKRPILNTYYKLIYLNHHEKSGQTDLQTRPLVEMLIAYKNLFDGVCTAFILSVFIPGAVGSLVFRHGHQLICLMKVE